MALRRSVEPTVTWCDQVAPSGWLDPDRQRALSTTSSPTSERGTLIGHVTEAWRGSRGLTCGVSVDWYELILM